MFDCTVKEKSTFQELIGIGQRQYSFAETWRLADLLKFAIDLFHQVEIEVSFAPGYAVDGTLRFVTRLPVTGSRFVMP